MSKSWTSALPSAQTRPTWSPHRLEAPEHPALWLVGMDAVAAAPALPLFPWSPTLPRLSTEARTVSATQHGRITLSLNLAGATSALSINWAVLFSEAASVYTGSCTYAACPGHTFGPSVTCPRFHGLQGMFPSITALGLGFASHLQTL